MISPSSGRREGAEPDSTCSGATVDKSLAVYWEHVVAVTDTGCEVLDLREDEDVTFYDHR
jgi:methionyl aminopeptidase